MKHKSTKRKFSVSVIIPSYNNKDLLEKNLPMVVEAKGVAKSFILEIIVVDDASSDGSYEYLKNNFPQVIVIRHKTNRGFSAAVNTGARSARGSLLALLNTDVSPSSDFLEKVIPHFLDKDVFAVSLHEKGFGWAKGVFREGYIVHEGAEESDKTQETFWVSGGSGVFRRSTWMKLGGMDEKLFSPFYWEDIDLCYRALKRGYKLLWEAGAIVSHRHESTVGKLDKLKTSRIQERNQLIFIWKNLTSRNLFRRHVAGLVGRISQHPGYLRIVLMALAHAGEILRARRKEEKEGKVSDEAIFAKYA